MFKNLPRHQFANLRSKVFPACFTTVGICCAVSVGCFWYAHDPWKSSSTDEKYEFGFLVAAFVFNLTNLFVLTPTTIKTMKQRHRVEREVAKRNQKRVAINKKFGMFHGVAALATIMTFGSLGMHSWYLATKIDL
ncbi:hypothetical protein QVD17_41087 [Tagetes erecta]|uniref:TMEM205-like domain-containing protein n=1 Tax=Tagetes erecta TaxID=13708 RepID=A0AAD8JWL3_TARER|nr:hypothetical protein QVD17_41087 [Tagetes erecta]